MASSETEEAQPEEVVAEVVPDGSILSAEAVREHKGSVRTSGLRRSGEQTNCELTRFQWKHSSSTKANSLDPNTLYDQGCLCPLLVPDSERAEQSYAWNSAEISCRGELNRESVSPAHSTKRCVWSSVPDVEAVAAMGYG